ncbi:MAG: hypothetical protein V2A73_19620 [Pseudomonadota bacterium]
MVMHRERLAKSRSPWWALVLPAVCSLSATSCVDVHGGAVELSWVMRRPDGEQTECVDWGLTGVRLELMQVVDEKPNEKPNEKPDGGDQRQTRYRPTSREGWPCELGRASSRFDVPPGSWALRLIVLCDAADGGPPTSVRVPDSVVREFVDGEVVELGALLITVDRSTADQPCKARTSGTGFKKKVSDRMCRAHRSDPAFSQNERAGRQAGAGHIRPAEACFFQLFEGGIQT